MKKTKKPLDIHFSVIVNYNSKTQEVIAYVATTSESLKAKSLET